jgi:hypothetical protein
MAEPYPHLEGLLRNAPTVRFIIFEILETGVLFLECLRNSAWCARDHATRFFVLVFAFLAIKVSNVCSGASTTLKKRKLLPDKHTKIELRFRIN